MTNFVHDDVMDLELAGIAAGNRMYLCNAYPTNFTQASVTYKLGERTLTTGIGNGVFSAGNGAVDGRKLTVAEQAAITITAAGAWSHIAICTNSGGGKVLRVWELVDGDGDPITITLPLGATATAPVLTHTIRDLS